MTFNRRTLTCLILLAVALVGTAQAHTMFLKLDSYFLAPNSSAMVRLINGDFDVSENAIARNRMLDVSIVGPGGTMHPPMSAWRDSALYEASEEDLDTAVLSFETGSAGTYVLGISTAATVFTLTADEFNEYLAHDRIVDAIEQRKAAGKWNDEATERYSKYVKALVQVGEQRSADFSHELEYPAEFVPLQNPYELGVGDELQVRFLRAGQPVANQIVYASHENYHAHGESDEHVEAVSTRTNAQGIASIPISTAGQWYIRTIHMVETTTEPDVDYESNWATLTFAIR
jgi:hypothetical protein